MNRRAAEDEEKSEEQKEGVHYDKQYTGYGESN